MTDKVDRPPGADRFDGARSWRTLYLVGGLSAITFVVLLLVALALDLAATPPEHGGARTLEFIGANTTVYVAQQILWTIPAVFAVLVFVALFAALESLGRSLALIATVVGGLAWALILAIPVTSRGSLALVYLSDRYAEAAPSERGVYATAAEAIIAQNNTPAMPGILSALGILLISVVMTRGIMSRFLAWAGIATGSLGVAGETLRFLVPMLYSVYGVLLWAWFTAVGLALLQVARQGSLPGENLTPHAVLGGPR